MAQSKKPSVGLTDDSDKKSEKNNSTEVEKNNKPAGKRSNIDSNKNRINIPDFKKIILDKTKDKSKVAIFTHTSPDPDAIGSMMGMVWFLKKEFGLDSDCFYGGGISHPQNMAMCNLLEPGLRLFDEYKENDYGIRVLVDTVPSNANVGDNQVEFDIVIDHHKENPVVSFKGLYINLAAGSACGTVFEIIKEFQSSFDSNSDYDTRVATALMVGIITDTENMMSDDTTEYEFNAYWKLFEFRDSISLKQIVKFKRPKAWIDAKAAAAATAIVDSDGVAVVGMGVIPTKQRDLISGMADEMVQWSSVETSISFALIDGDRIEGSVRTNNASISVPELCKILGGKYGTGGGKLGKGAYKYDLGGMSIEEDDEDNTKIKAWEFINEKETKRIFRSIKK